MSRKKSNINEKNLKEIGSRIRLIRKTYGLNQAEFSESIGISSNYLSNLETGKFKPSMPILLAIKNRYSIIPKAILTGQEFTDIGKTPYLNKIKEAVPEYGLQGLEERDWFRKTYEIIASKTIYSSALISNINAFHHTIQQNNEIKTLQKKYDDLKARLEAVEKGLAKTPKAENTEKKVM